MFTGIVRELGRVQAVEAVDGSVRLAVEAPQTAAQASIGDSVAVAGVCLTVVAVEEGRLAFDAVPETLRRSSLGRLEPGSRVNLEPSLRVGEPLGGHVVQGHVDGVGAVRSLGDPTWLDAPPELLRYCAEKGSIAVEGCSLTIAELDGAGFAVALIPHTLEVTTLGALEAGDPVNLEVDVLAKYVERLLPRG
ncbi:MAG TPA: riboflavin synthase [Gaiellaceae bacterium]|nr:riboflavin synthase [Gaiellaceae bacterium]